MSVVRRGPLTTGRGKGLAWFRLFGVGLSWTNHRLHPPLFSERYAGQHGIPKRRRVHIGDQCFLVTTNRRP